MADDEINAILAADTELAKRYRKTGARAPSADERTADHAALEEHIRQTRTGTAPEGDTRA